MTDHHARVLFVVAALALLVVMAAQVRRDDGQSALSHAARMVVSPIVDVTLGGAERLSRAWDGLIALRAARRERDELRERVERLEEERIRYREALQENARLRELLDLTTQPGYEQGVVARVCANVSGGPLRHAVLVDRGSKHGVSSGWVAIRGGALIGRLVVVTRRHAEVMLILDPDSGVAVRHQLDRYAGVLRGGNQATARLEYVPRDHPVAVGDAIVTSGLDGLFPPGLLVGHVRELFADSPLTWRIHVEVTFSPETLEEVLLVPPAGAESP
ncbi:MAG: rod shape-determining protein MreC [Acidobacteriota bacterium]|nr:MAG: rod shape-determining protein MreC [Acidobacteriota bacterium]